MSMNLRNGYFQGSIRFRISMVTLLALVCSACGMHLREQPQRAQNLAGQWQLQTPQREALAISLRSVMEQAHAKEEKRFWSRIPKEDREPDGDAATNNKGPRGSRGADNSGGLPNNSNSRPNGPFNNWEAREHRQQQEELLNAVLPANKLQINQTTMRIELAPDVGARRRFDMGERSTLVTGFATLRIESGWKDNVFVVYARDADAGIEIIERYRRLGDNLYMQVELKIPEAKQQVFSATYVPLH